MLVIVNQLNTGSSRLPHYVNLPATKNDDKEDNIAYSKFLVGRSYRQQASILSKVQRAYNKAQILRRRT